MTVSPKTPRPILRRRVVHAGWALVALAFLTFFLLDLRLDYVQLQTPCGGENCNYLAISTAEVTVLNAWGVPIQVYATAMTGLSVIYVAVYWLLGGLILWRQTNSRIGPLVSLAILAIPIATVADSDNVAANFEGLLIPALFLSLLGNTFLLMFIFLFPSGHFVPRWAPLHLIATISLFAVYNLDLNGILPLSPAALQFVLATVVSLLALACGFQIYRYLRVSTPIERLQTKWTLIGFFFLLLSFTLWLAFFGGGLQFQPGETRLLASVGGWLGVMMTGLALPIALTFAILQHRLWDIDLVIRRTLIYSILTAALSLVFFGVVVVLQALFDTVIGDRQNELVTVLSTLTVAALFTPLRSRVQTLIDRRFFRQRYNTENVLAAFGSTLKNEVDLNELHSSILEVVEETMQPASISLWLREREK